MLHNYTEKRTAVNYRQKNVNWKLMELLNINDIISEQLYGEKTAVNYRQKNVNWKLMELFCKKRNQLVSPRKI